MVTSEQKLTIVVVMCVFGSLVHIAEHYRRSRDEFNWLDTIPLFLTANFSGAVFYLIALLISENEIHWYLATATGAFLGLAGLSRVTDLIITVIAKR